MILKTYAELLALTIPRLRQVSGPSTQLYSETVIGSYIQEGYDILRSEAWWPWMMKWITGTLDGTTGKCASGAWGSVARYEDIQAIYHNNHQRALPQLPEEVNPFSVAGTIARFVEPLSVHDDPNQQYLFRVWPLATTGTIYVRARANPSGLFTVPTVTVPLDAYCLMNYAMWRYMSDDAANPDGAAAALQVYEKRKAQLFEEMNNSPVALDPRIPYDTSAWQELG